MKSTNQSKSKLIMIICLITLSLLVIYFMVSFIVGWITPSYTWGEYRKPCTLFNQTQYTFKEIDIQIKNQECGTKNNEGKIFFTIGIINKINKPVSWSIKNFTVEGVEGIEYDCGIAYCSPFSTIQINETTSIKLYSFLKGSDNLYIQNSGVI